MRVPLPLVELLSVAAVCVLFRRRPVAVGAAALAAALVAPRLLPPQAFTDLYSPAFLFSKKVPVDASVFRQSTQRQVEYTSTGMKLNEHAALPRHLKPGQVLVRVHAAAINPVDWKLGRSPFLRFLKPKVGFDFSGTVLQSASPRFQTQQEVFGEADWGALAEFVVVRDHLLLEKPAKLSHLQAASLVMGFKTSYEALVEVGELSRGHTVLVLGAAGGCGMFGVQIARHVVGGSGHVLATCSASKREFVKTLGATRIIDYQTQDWSEVGSGVVDVIYDAVGDRDTLAKAALVLKPGTGRLVSIAQPIWPWHKLLYPHTWMKKFTMRFGGDNLQAAVSMLEQGQLVTEVQQVFQLQQFQQAFELLKTQRVRGKLVFDIYSDQS